MLPTDWQSVLQQRLDELNTRHLLRARHALEPQSSTRIRQGNDVLLNFASNDYLGLTHHPRVKAAVAEAVARWGVGSGAAPLISGYTDAHASAEASIARWKGTESAVLFSSGYQANVAMVQMLEAVGAAEGRSTRFLLDKLCHASLIDAVRSLSPSGGGTAYRVFPHNGTSKLARLLNDAGREKFADVVVTESIFSMDGDAANLPAITSLLKPDDARRPLLVVDEAHGSGVYGPDGAGWASEVGLAGRVDLTVVTLSKALGGIGAAICGSRLVCDALVNFGRGYIFSTSMPAAMAAAAEAAINVCREEPWRQQRVRALARLVRKEVSAIGLHLPVAAVQPDDSPIIPILLGEETLALTAAARLRERGLLVMPIRPPTVPPGGSRLRVTMSCEHSDADIDLLLSSLRGLSEQL